MPINEIYLVLDCVGENVEDWNYYLSHAEAQEYIEDNEMYDVEIVKFVRVL